MGRRKIYLTGSNHTISNNVITDQDYASAYINNQDHDIGAWEIMERSYNSYANQVRAHIYQFTKYGCASSDAGKESAGVWMDSSGVTITNNEMMHMNEGINAQQSDTYEISFNNLRDLASICFTATGYGQDGQKSSIHNNTFSDCNSVFRFQHWNGSYAQQSGTNNSNINIYNNKSWLPTNIGTHIFYHYDIPESSEVYNITKSGTIWWYHNSFSGGRTVSTIHQAATNYTPRGMENVYYVNNIMSSLYIERYEVNLDATLGGCWYNWKAGIQQPTWCNHSSNHNNGTTLMWDSSTLLEDWTPTDSNAINSGIDISRPFMINGITYPALPGFSSNYFTGTRPDMGAAQSGGISDTTPPAAPQWVSVE